MVLLWNILYLLHYCATFSCWPFVDHVDRWLDLGSKSSKSFINIEVSITRDRFNLVAYLGRRGLIGKMCTSICVQVAPYLELRAYWTSRWDASMWVTLINVVLIITLKTFMLVYLVDMTWIYKMYFLLIVAFKLYHRSILWNVICMHI